MNQPEMASFFQRLKKGMDESIFHSRGGLRLKTTLYRTNVHSPTARLSQTRPLCPRHRASARLGRSGR